jgi:hypothetical protein
MELELFICAVEEVFRGMFVDLMEFVFSSVGSGCVISCVVSCRRLGIEMWMGFLPVLVGEIVCVGWGSCGYDYFTLEKHISCNILNKIVMFDRK